MTQISPATFARYSMQAVPRYTSYPTAPHFHGGVTQEDYRAWLSGLNPSDPVSLYLHVPFCRQVCWYCGCNMKLASRYEPVAQYVEALLKEIDLLANATPDGLKISHLHWGGGTPTALRPDDLHLVMDAVAGRFSIIENAELAIECDPRTLTQEMVDRIGEIGFTRASFGVQEFDPKVQKAINRLQPPEMVRDCVSQLRSAGIGSVNFDLIYGLPHQTVQSLENTVELCAEMSPERIALFGYAHVPWMAKKQRLIDEAALPGAGERLAQHTAAGAAFAKRGYVPVGLDHFALPSDSLAKAAENGGLRRNFQGYTTDKATTLLGVGSTSIGRTPGGYIQNNGETGAWRRLVENGEFPIAKGRAFSPEDRLRGDVIEALMCFGEADLSKIGKRHTDLNYWWSEERPKLDVLIADGLITMRGQTIKMAPGAEILVRVVASVFDSYFQSKAGKHSVAV